MLHIECPQSPAPAGALTRQVLTVYYRGPNMSGLGRRGRRCGGGGAVGEFRRLALLAEADGHLRQKLQQVLKLSKEKWDDARDHALRAVVADNRMRIWYADKASMELGLLFACRLGNVALERPVGARALGMP